MGARRSTTRDQKAHVGLVAAWACYDVCRDAWGMYIRDSLRSLIETGTGMPSSNPDETDEAVAELRASLAAMAH